MGYSPAPETGYGRVTRSAAAITLAAVPAWQCVVDDDDDADDGDDVDDGSGGVAYDSVKLAGCRRARARAPDCLYFASSACPSKLAARPVDWTSARPVRLRGESSRAARSATPERPWMVGRRRWKRW